MSADKVTIKKRKHKRIRQRIRKKLQGSQERPRVCIKKSNRFIYAQVIDDDNHRVLAAASTLEQDFRAKNKNTKNVEASKALGRILAKRLKEKKIKTIVFDRGYYPYHGRIRLLAEGLRKEGIIF
ncbi:MAG: 50S ribosomal protein L18 [Candidatus Aminicenantes bacterium]|jgi:large subunit ribosomal protein L18